MVTRTISYEREVHTWEELSAVQQDIIVKDYYPQVISLYANLQPFWKRCPLKEEDGKEKDITKFQKAAKIFHGEQGNIFPSIEQEFLDDQKLFKWPTQKMDRHFCGKLLQHMVKELTGYNMDYAKLFKTAKRHFEQYVLKCLNET